MTAVDPELNETNVRTYDRYALPADPTELDTDTLAARAAEIQKLAKAVTADDIDAAGGDNGITGIDYIESLTTAREAVDAVLAERREAEKVEADRKAAALAALESAAADPAPAEPVEELSDDDPEPAPAEAPVDTPVDPAPVEAAPVADPTPVEPAADPAPEAAPTAEAPAPAELAVETVQPDQITQPVPAATKLAALNAQRTSSELPNPSGTTGNSLLQAAGTQDGHGRLVPGHFLDGEDATINYFTDQLLRRDTSKWTGDRHQVTLASSTIDYGDQMLLPGDVDHNAAVFANAQNDYEETLVAAGGPCAPLMPSYDFVECFAPQMPVMQGLPVVGAQRGGIRYLNVVGLGGDAANAVTHLDTTQMGLLPGDAGFVEKDCTRVPCPSESEARVETFAWCVLFDNLNYRVFPEQVRNMLRRVAVEYAKAKDVFLLNRIDQIATASTGVPIDVATAAPNPYGAARSMFADLRVAAHHYRKRNNMNLNQPLDVWLPDVAEEQLAIDTVNDMNMGAISNLNQLPAGDLTRILAQRANLNVRFYYYDATEASFPQSAHADAINPASPQWAPLPSKFRAYMYSPGAIVRLDAGQLDLGLIRDSKLAGQNDLMMFAEEWLQVAHPGCEVQGLDLTACANGAGPAGVTPFTC